MHKSISASQRLSITLRYFVSVKHADNPDFHQTRQTLTLFDKCVKQTCILANNFTNKYNLTSDLIVYLKMPKNKPSITRVLLKYVSEFGKMYFRVTSQFFFTSYVKFEYLQIKNT